MNEHFRFVNIPLPFEYDGLEPYIDAKTMELHHGAHLQGYIDKLNALIAPSPELHELPLEQLILEGNNYPNGTAIVNNAGGVFNHFFFFEQLGRENNQPHGEIEELINKRFGSFEAFKEEFAAAAMSVFGSGYAWLVLTPHGLELATTKNQDVPLEEGIDLLLNLDVWEHAYYLKHHNKRANYIDDFFNVVNFKVVSARLSDAMQKE